MTVEAMRERFDIRENAMNVSKKPCRFLRGNECIIEFVKPETCRRWPWIELNRTIEGQRKSAKRCPGIILEDDPEWHR